MVISIGFQIGFVTCFEIYDQAMMIITFTNNGNLSLNKSDVLMTHYKSDIILNQVFAISSNAHRLMTSRNYIVNVSKFGNKF
jgi:hypothetical protein